MDDVLVLFSLMLILRTYHIGVTSTLYLHVLMCGGVCMCVCGMCVSVFFCSRVAVNESLCESLIHLPPTLCCVNHQINSLRCIFSSGDDARARSCK